MGSSRPSSGRAVNANGDQVGVYSAIGQFRHELYGGGSIISVYFAVFLKVLSYT